MVSVTHDAEEHAVDTYRSLDDVRRVAFAAFGIEIFDFLTAEFGVLREVEVRAGVDTLHFFESERHTEFDVAGCIGIVCQFFVVVEAIVLRAEAQCLVPSHAGLFPAGEPLEFGAGLDKELHLHLLELSHAEDKLSSHDLIAEGLTDLRDTERNLHAAGLLHVEVVDKNTLGRFRSEVDGAAAVGGGAHLGFEHEVKLSHLSPVACAADRANDLLVEDDLAESFEVGGVHGHGIALVECIALLGEFAHAAVGGAEFGLIKGLFEALAPFGHFFLDLLVVFGDLVLDEHVGAVAFFRVLIVDERIVEGIDVSGSLPNGGMHKDGRIDAHDVFVEQRHSLPPILFDIVFQLNTELTIVVNGAETVVNFAGREHKTVLFAV